jgi:hypothetical protein
MTPYARRQRLLSSQRQHSPKVFHDERRPPHGSGIILACLAGANCWIWGYVVIRWVMG